jgi:hypothetical protein
MRASHGPDSSLLQMVFDASSQTFRCSMAMGWRGVSDNAVHLGVVLFVRVQAHTAAYRLRQSRDSRFGADAHVVIWSSSSPAHAPFVAVVKEGRARPYVRRPIQRGEDIAASPQEAGSVA